MKKISLVVTFLLVISLSVSFATPSNWAVQEIEKAKQYGLTSDSILSNYQTNITREEFAELAVKLYEALSGNKAIATSPNPFNDTSNVEVLKANNLGIVGGVGGGRFAPKDSVTREQIATMFYRTIKSADQTLIDNVYEVTFTDKNEISAYALEAIGFMNSKRIIGGVGNNRVNPKGNATREQAIAMVTRAYERFSVEIGKRSRLNDLAVHFIDVGQGDSILIVSPTGKVMLIDGGTKTAGEQVVSYLKKAGITTIHKMVATHPHEDHIGGLIPVLENFTVEKVYDSGFPHTTKTYENFLTLIKDKKIPAEIAHRGNEIKLDDNLKIKILHPGETMGDINNNSIVLHMTYNQVSFLFTGDAEKEAEEMILNYDKNIKASVFKVGHHGSRTSTTQEFLDIVNPQYAVIQVGIDNTYNHPTQETLDKLNAKEIEILRNDMHGDIVVFTDGKAIKTQVQNEVISVELPIKDERANIIKRININTATFEELKEIIHIDDDRARQILELRPFQSVDDLVKVKGIAAARLADIKNEGKAYVE